MSSKLSDNRCEERRTLTDALALFASLRAMLIRGQNVKITRFGTKR